MPLSGHKKSHLPTPLKSNTLPVGPRKLAGGINRGDVDSD